MHNSLTISLLQARETAMSWFRPVLNQHNLTEQQWRIIRTLAQARSIDFHQLSLNACISRPSLTGILTRLERDGLVVRLKPVNDQRRLYVSLTPQGEDLFQAARSAIEAGYCQIEQRFGSAKLAQLQQLLEQFTAITHRNPPSDTP